MSQIGIGYGIFYLSSVFFFSIICLKYCNYTVNSANVSAKKYWNPLNTQNLNQGNFVEAYDHAISPKFWPGKIDSWL